MDLIIESSDICRTRIFAGDSNQLVYEIATGYEIFSRAPTVIYRHHDGTRSEVGRIEWSILNGTSILCHGQQIYMKDSGILTQSQVYRALNGLSYKWKIDGEPILRKNDSSKKLIAAYSPKSGIFSRHNRPEMVKVAPDGMAILDELVITFVYFEKKRRERRRRHRSAVGSNPAMMAASNTSMMNGATF